MNLVIRWKGRNVERTVEETFRVEKDTTKGRVLSVHINIVSMSV
jgi:hypothetical protein